MKVRTALAATAGTAVLVGAGLAAGTATSASASTPSVATAKHQLLDPQQRAELRRTGHVTVVRHTAKRGDVTILVQRGVVLHVDATSLTLRSRDGMSHTYVIGPKTKVVEKRVQVSVADLHAGERAMVVAVQTPRGDVARRISCLRDPKAVAGSGTPSPSATS